MAKMKFQDSRLTIGLLINQLDGNYESSIWHSITDYTEKLNINLIILQGQSLNSPGDFESRQNIIYNLIDVDRFDGFIISTGSLSNYLEYDKFLDFIQPLQKKPLVSLSIKLKNIPSIFIDNESGMKSIIRHLIQKHGYKKIAFVKGPENNYEANLRLKAYKDVLAENNIDIDPEYIIPGDFNNESGLNAINIIYRQRKLDVVAIAFANDNMAVFSLYELNNMGIKVPDDVAITGFDNSIDNNFAVSQITTVNQPIKLLGIKAVDTIMEIINGNKPDELIKIPAELIIRKSCGCCQENEIKNSIKQSNIKLNKDIDSSINNKFIDYIIPKLDVINTNDSVYKNEIIKIITLFDSVINNEIYENDFVKNINDLIEKAYFNDDTVYNRDELLMQLRFYYLAEYQNDVDKIILIDSLIQRILLLIRDTKEKKETYQKILFSKSHWILRHIFSKINSTYNVQDVMSILKKGLPGLNISSCIICFYQSSPSRTTSDTWIIPEDSKVLLAYNKNRNIDLNDINPVFKTLDLVPDKLIPEKARFTYIVKSLNTINQHFGYIILELIDKQEIINTVIQEQLSYTIEKCKLIEKQKTTEEELKDTLFKLATFNKELQSMSTHDELTGLYNRRGFETLAEQHYQFALRSKKSFLLIFIDLDNLKIINDTFGHEEGDIAITSVSNLLKSTFRSSDIMARVGGDEFIVLVKDNNHKDLIYFKERLLLILNHINIKLEKPFEISVSFGATDFDPEETEKTQWIPSLDELLKKADNELYKQKRLKKRKSN